MTNRDRLIATILGQSTDRPLATGYFYFLVRLNRNAEFGFLNAGRFQTATFVPFGQRQSHQYLNKSRQDRIARKMTGKTDEIRTESIALFNRIRL